MTPHSPRRTTLTRAAVALAAAVVGVGVVASPAQAEPAPYDLKAEAAAWDGDFYVGGSPETERQKAFFNVQLDDMDEDLTEESMHVVFGVGDDLGGLTFETDREGCSATGATITCDFIDVTWWSYLEVEFDVLVPPTVGAYDQVDWTVSVEPGSYDTQQFFGTWEFLPINDSDTEYHTQVFSSFTDVEPGSSLVPEIAFKNAGSFAYTGVYLSFWEDTPYLDVDSEYSNCGSTDYGEVMCVFRDWAPEPGDVYELSADTPLTHTLDEKAPGPITYRNWFQVQIIDDFAQSHINEAEFPDTDKVLEFEPSDLGDVEDQPTMEVRSAANPWDVSVAPTNIDASADDTTVLPIPIENSGPAHADARTHPGSGEGSFTITVQLPTGLELHGTDEYGHVMVGDLYCSDAHKAEWLQGTDPALFEVERLDVQCYGLELIEDGEQILFELPVKVTGEESAADGLVVIHEGPEVWDFSGFEEHWGLSEDDYPIIDSDQSNNKAELGLNAADQIGGGDPSGQLPNTGASLTIVVGSAAAVLAAGAGVFIVLRRRRAATEW